MNCFPMQQEFLVITIRGSERSKKRKQKVATSLVGAQAKSLDVPKNNMSSKGIEPLHSADNTGAVKPKKSLRERFSFRKSSTANKDLVPKNSIPENLAPEDSIPENLAPEDLVPEDSVPEDLVSEDLVPEDLPSKVDSEPKPAATELPSLQEQLALSPSNKGTSIASISTTSTEWERLALANTPTRKPPPNPRRVAAMLAAQAKAAAEAQASQRPETPKISTFPVNRPKMSVNSSVDESGSFAAHQTFLSRTFQLLITENASIESDLRALENAVRERELEMSSAKATDEAAMHTKVWDAQVKSQTLEKRLLGKDELVQSLYIKIDGHENTIRTQAQAFKDLRNRTHNLEETVKQMGRDSRTRVHNLEETIKQKDREHRSRVHNLEEVIMQKERSLDHNRREYSSAIMRLEREKRALVEQTGVLDEQLETQKTMIRHLQANSHNFKVYAKDMAQGYEFYRSHYEKYKKHFAEWDANDQMTSDGTQVDGHGSSSQDNGGGAGDELKSLSESESAGTDESNISTSSSTNESHAEGASRDLEHDSTLVGEDLN
ncbi:uncharacterized protein L3040_006405 [Drepanopeziza brunnea f. sp. 'multigermtubi']|uniref:uncharacterized protein n=1 Tax=Drepanopeziza brunnea f. sp. 'multigermtubi' TaxID=698441 RepID=UPI00238CA803|nr:hypothetical protein L3040_006405 [Drepanopeziza brunnea f. sp. 'multigermtubi']